MRRRIKCVSGTSVLRSGTALQSSATLRWSAWPAACGWSRTGLFACFAGICWNLRKKCFLLTCGFSTVSRNAAGIARLAKCAPAHGDCRAAALLAVTEKRGNDRGAMTGRRWRGPPTCPCQYGAWPVSCGRKRGRQASQEDVPCRDLPHRPVSGGNNAPP
jgi:hypothetical protein